MTGLRAKLQQLVLNHFFRDRVMLRQQLEEKASASHLLYNHLLACEKDWQCGFRQFLHCGGEFCGDLVLARATPTGRIIILHADATGHGLAATLTLLPLAGSFKQAVDQNQSLKQVITAINQQLCQLLPNDRFMAATLVEIDPVNYRLLVWNGSMPPLLLLDEQGGCCHYFHSQNLALGILDRMDLQLESQKLPETGYLFGFSDGLCDQMNDSGQCWGQHGMLEYLQHPDDERLFVSIMQAMHKFRKQIPLMDDISMFILNLQQVIKMERPCDELLTGEADNPNDPLQIVRVDMK